MKKIFYQILSAVAFFLLTACGPSQREKDENQAQAEAQQQADLVKAAELAQRKAAEEERARLAAEQKRMLQQFQACIATVLEKDDAAKGNPYTMKSISLEGCPTDFSQVYTLHIYAWEDDAKVVSALNNLNSDDNVKKTLVVSGLCALFDCPATPIKDAIETDTFLRQKKTETSTAITETYRAVEIVALKYGVSLRGR